MAYGEIRLARGGSEATVDARTYHQRCSRDLHVSTETWSKVRDLIEKSETRESKISGLCRYFSTNFENIVTTTKLQFFRISGIFPTCFVCLSTNTTEKNTLIYKSFTKPYRCSDQRLMRIFLWLRRDLKSSRLRLERWAVSRPKRSLNV